VALDFLRLKNMVDELKESSDDIIYVFVQDKHGQVLSHTFQAGFPIELKDANEVPLGSPQHIQLLDVREETGEDKEAGERVYDFAIPVTISKERLGTVRVGLSQVKAHAAVHQLLFTIFYISAGAGLMAVVLGTLFAGTVTRRLNVLRQSSEDIVRGNLDLQTSPQQRNCWDIRIASGPNAGLRRYPPPLLVPGGNHVP
jgi:hypothetical protein